MADTSPSIMAARLIALLRERWLRLRAREDSRLLLAAAAALGFHLLAILIATGGFGILVGLPDLDVAGDAAGKLEGVNAEIIDATEFDRRYVSFGTGRDAADTEPTEAAKPDPEPPRKAAAPASVEAPPEPAEPAILPARPPARKQLSEADIAEILESTKLDVMGATMAMSKAAEARIGVANEFVRGVLRILKQNMPKGTGMRGSVVIQFVVGLSGEIEAIRIARSSGRPALDSLVVDSVRATRVVAPNKTTTMRDRSFEITYEYN